MKRLHNMRYFSNSELVDLYDVSDKAVRNWIEAASQHRLSLELYEHKGKSYIADTVRNVSILEELAEKGKKFRNKRTHRDVHPTDEFYKTYAPNQILDIVNNLSKYSELPNSYLYFGKGAEYWGAYLEKLLEAGSGNTLTNTIDTIQLNAGYIKRLLEPYKKVNIVNICIGNCASIQGIIEEIRKVNKLGRIIAIDLSQDMINISEKKLASHFGGDIVLEGYLRDVSHQRFNDILDPNAFGDQKHTVNLCFFLAGPIVNFREPDQALHVIRDSMSKNDLLITTLKRDIPEARRFFDFNLDNDRRLLSAYNRTLLDLLNIKEELYEFEQSYDPSKKLRSMKIYPKYSLTLYFTLEGKETIVELKKGQPVMLWRAWHHSDQEIANRFRKNGFEIVQTSQSPDERLNFLITKVSTLNQELI